MRTKLSGVVVFAIALAACDGSGVAVVGPAPLTSVMTASIAQSTWPDGPVVVNYGCAGPSVLAPHLDILISALETVDVDQVTIHMIDGSNIGGPMITFPKARLQQRFGSTVVAGGTSRTFSFQPQFPCGGARPYSVSADIAFMDRRGVMQAVTIARPLP